MNLKRLFTPSRSFISLLFVCSVLDHADAFIITSPLSSATCRIQSSISTRPQNAELSSTTRSSINEKNDEIMEASASSSTTGPNTRPPSPTSSSRFLRLKDRMWVRETLEDLTAAEFACKLAPGGADDDEDDDKKKTKKNKNAVDFENLLTKLEKRIEDMCVRSTYGTDDDACIVSYALGDKINSEAFPKPEEECWSLIENYGMGSVTYTDDQRSALVLRLLDSRLALVQVMTGVKSDNDDTNESSTDLEQIREQLQTPDIAGEENSKLKNTPDPYLYVRDDGTVDWDGALQDQEALKKFGSSVWARINGQDPETIDEDSVSGASEGHGGDNKVTVKIIETDAIRELGDKRDSLKSELDEMEKKHTALLNSAVSAGSAVANVNLALLEPELRSTIRDSDNQLLIQKDQYSFALLMYELERIYTYLDGELGNTATKGYIPLQDRLNVAEFGLLESQEASMKQQIESGATVDSDVLAVVLEQVIDFKRRLGIDYYVAGLTFDQEAIKIWANDLLVQSKKGLGFYGKGCELFFNDLKFSSALIGKALTGYTLKPREVRTLRRTFKDVITFIPVVIILIIPLTPVGHVLVFGAIQRFYPDFFPSCFTESRQNLFSLYESTEYSEFTIDENWQEKTVRVLEAAGYFIVDNTRKLFSQVTTDRNDSNANK